MKLITESNWKQEIARLKAEKILVVHARTIAKDWLDNNEAERDTDKWCVVSVHHNTLPLRQEEIDKAVETIENVFVYKQCYIDS